MRVKLKRWYEGYQTLRGNSGKVGAIVGLARALVVVVGWMFCGVGFHARSKGVQSSYELDYATLFWLWILSWKYLNFMELSTFRGYYPNFVDIFTFRGYYLHLVYISALCGYYPHFVEISTFCGYYPHFMDMSEFCGYYLYWTHYELPSSYYLSYSSQFCSGSGYYFWSHCDLLSS